MITLAHTHTDSRSAVAGQLHDVSEAGCHGLSRHKDTTELPVVSLESLEYGHVWALAQMWLTRRTWGGWRSRRMEG